MKVVSVKLNIPYRFGEHESKAAEDQALIKQFLEARNLNIGPDQSIVCRAEDAIEAMIFFGKYEYNKVSVEEIWPLFDTMDETVDALHGVLSRLQIATTKFEAQTVACLPDDPSKPSYSSGVPGWNAKTASPISGPLLHSMNETMLCEDLCTDALQGYLNEGWRLIAVCPQESRRPDYVLGRVIDPQQILADALPRSAQRG